jgi:hypothetical protein
MAHGRRRRPAASASIARINSSYIAVFAGILHCAMLRARPPHTELAISIFSILDTASECARQARARSG